MKLEVNTLKVLVDIAVTDTSKDGLLRFVLEDIEEIILNYCNIRALPKGLEKTAYRMAMDLYRNENLGAEDSAGGRVTAVTEGDTRVEFDKGAYRDSSFGASLLKSYSAQLNQYRRLKW